MTTLKIATWNVNSLRVRLPHVLAWLADVKPDILALQETKVIDADFPYDALHQAGYHAVASGQKTYNGVAILSREKTLDGGVREFINYEDPQRRILGVSVGNVRILNLYIPNGQTVESEKFQYKLNWLQNLNAFLKKELETHENMVVLGDFNIAPQEIDVHDPASWEGQVLFSQPERQAFEGILQMGFADCFREQNPNEQSYSWWDYRVNAFKRNMGMRIDHLLASKSLNKNCINSFIDKTPRGWERPSDHAPVVAEFAI